MEERNFYIACVRCGRLESQIKAEGPVEGCRGHCGAKIDNHFRRKRPVNDVWDRGRAREKFAH
jgi:hypothetical protein